MYCSLVGITTDKRATIIQSGPASNQGGAVRGLPQ